MKRNVRRFLVVALLATAPWGTGDAGLADCQNIYVGMLWLERDHSLRGVVFLQAPGDSSGSYWTWLSGWSADDKRALLSALMTAKINQIPISVETVGGSGCSLTSPGPELLRVLY